MVGNYKSFLWLLPIVDLSAKTKIINVLLICLLSSYSSVKSQEIIPTYSDYLTDNLYLLYPSMAGASNFDQIRLTARRQWFDVENAPNLHTLAINFRAGEKIGLGGIAFHDENGNFSKLGAYGSFAYHLMFSRSTADLHQLSFGVNGGVIQQRLDQSRFTEFDPILGSGNRNDIYANMDLGASYFVNDFYFHVVAKNVLILKRSLFYTGAAPGNLRRYLFSGGYIFTPNINRPWSFEPSVLLRVREATNEISFDANVKAYYDLEYGNFWAGISYRNSLEGAEYMTDSGAKKEQQLRYITPFVGVKHKRFLVGYTFSYQLNSLVVSNTGFHQLTLGYNFGESRERFSCKCPAINN